MLKESIIPIFSISVLICNMSWLKKHHFINISVGFCFQKKNVSDTVEIRCKHMVTSADS